MKAEALGSIPTRHRYGNVLLGEQRASKTLAQGSNPCMARCLLMLVWLDLARHRTRNAVDVGATPTAGFDILGVWWRHATLRTS